MFFNEGICYQIKVFPGIFCLTCIFWYYYRTNFELKNFLIKYFKENLYLNDYKWLLSQNRPVKNDFFGL